ncbi:MAG: flagellar biosynthesis anti-sigma factor FlgM [Roseinatronobacter sp.]|nr:flagellar biosynthesis anti-sigma factor FlgM [Roseinatronobacter sp.]
MVNSITSNISQLRGIAETDLSRSGKAPPGGGIAQPSPIAGAEDVILSSAARTLPAEMTKGPPVNEALVAHLSSEIAAGRYPLDPGKIAEALSSQVSLIAE